MSVLIRKENGSGLSEGFLLRLLGKRRHDLINHLQIILGALAIGRPEDAKESLKRLVDELKQEHHLSNLRDPSFSTFLFAYPILYPDIQFSVEMPIPVTLPDSFEERKGGEHLSHLLQWIGEHAMISDQGRLSLLFRVEKGERGMPLFTVDYVGTLIGDVRSEEHDAIMEELEKNFQILEMVRNDEEWFMTLLWMA